MTFLVSIQPSNDNVKGSATITLSHRSLGDRLTEFEQLYLSWESRSPGMAKALLRSYDNLYNIWKEGFDFNTTIDEGETIQ